MLDLIIRGGTIIDGSGAPGYLADIGVKDGLICKIGDLSALTAGQVIDAEGLTVTPGFIDMHSHADCSVPMWPNMESALGQGITTCFAGHCGMGVAPVHNYWLEQGFEARAFNRVIPQTAGGPIPGKGRVLETGALRPAFEAAYGVPLDWSSFGEYIAHLERAGHGANLAINVGHGQLRQQFLGHNACRAASPREIQEMAEELARCFSQGAFGLSFGFDYVPSMYAEPDEMIALMEVAGDYDAIVTAHMQNGPERWGKVNPRHTALDGFTEFLELGLQTGVRLHISHIYTAFEAPTGSNADIIARASAEASLELVERYRQKGVQVTWDYLGTHAAAVFFFPQLATRFRPYVDECGGKQGFARALQNPWYRDAVANEIRSGKHRAATPFAFLNPSAGARWGENLLLSGCSEAQFIGRSIAQIAEALGLDCVDTALELMVRDPETLCDRKRETDPIAGHAFVRDEDMSFGTDNGAHDYDFIEQDGADMPYIKGTPTEFGGMVEYFKTFSEFPFEALVKRMAGNASRALGLKDRGLIKEGMCADLVVIDRDSLSSNMSLAEPRTAPDGIEWVMVNGKVAVERKKHMHPRSGQVITRPTK